MHGYWVLEPWGFGTTTHMDMAVVESTCPQTAVRQDKLADTNSL